MREFEGGSASNIDETREQAVLFDGDNPVQAWYYRVRDVAAFDVGTLTAVQLYVFYDVPVADLQSPAFTWDPPQAEEGRAFWTRAQIRNAGLGAAGTSHAELYLSTDNDFDTSDDFYLGERAVGALAAGTSTEVQWNFTMPNLGSGTYTVWPLVVVDSQGEIAETDENNAWKAAEGFSAIDGPPAPDLEATYAAWAESATIEGVPFWVRTQITNSGTGTAPASHAKLFLSTDNDFDISDDYLVGELPVGALAEGASQWVQWDFQVPDLASGSYPVWMVWVVDSQNEVTELNEINTAKTSSSFMASDPPPQGDLRAAEFAWASEVMAEGSLVWARVWLSNAGPTQVAASHARLYLSTDDDLDPSDDYLLGEKLVGALAVNASEVVQWDFYMPNLGPGNYPVRVVCVVDSRNEVFETDENNVWRSSASYTAESPAREYLAECSSTPTFESPADSGWILEKTFTFLSLERGQDYYYRVKVRQGDRESAWSNIEVSHQDPAATLTVTPTYADFGTVLVGHTVERSFTVENTGGGVLTGTASADAPYAITGGSPYTLGAGETAQVTVSFTPLAVGSFSGTAAFESDGGALTLNLTTLARTEVVGRHVFYNGSSWDGRRAAADASDDQAIASDKSALRPGGTATFANYTSFGLGLNGLMVDIPALAGLPTADDFAFRIGNTPDLASWVAGPDPQTVTVRPGAGTGGSDRITLVWGADAVKKQWLEITVLATEATGLAQPDVFYFGNAVGETGNTPANAQVSSADALRILLNTTADAPLDSRFDINRDGKVGSADRLIVLSNLSVLFPLVLLNLTPPGGAPSVALDTARVQNPGVLLTSWRVAGDGLHAQWVSDGWPVTIRTTVDPSNAEWDTLDRLPAGAPAGQVLEFVLPFDPDSPLRFYRLESAPGW